MQRIPGTPAWRRYLRFLRPNVEADVDDELRFHLAERSDELVAAGATADEATARALAEFGDVPAVRDDLRAIDRRIAGRRSRLEALSIIMDEVRYAVRRLVRQPGFTIPAVLTLALGLAATTAVFTLLDAVVLRPLPYPHAERLVSLSSPMPRLGDRWGLARHQLFYYKQHARTLEDLALYRANTITVMGDGGAHHAERARGAMVSASIFDVLGIRPALGRLLTADDNLAELPATVILGYDYWVSRFGGKRDVVGRTIHIEGFPLAVVGVASRGAHLPDQRVDLWLPDHIDPAIPAQNNHVRNAVGLLRPGFTALDAERELAPLVKRMDEVFPSAYPSRWIENSGFSTAVTPLRDEVVGATMVRALWILFASVAFVLFIAGANVANLFLVRADGRRREVAMRSALGAGRRHLALHHLAEGLLIALIAGAVAALLTGVALTGLAAVAPEGLPRLTEVRFGWQGVALVLGAAMVAGVVFGAIPLLHSHAGLSALRDAARGQTLSRRRVAARGALVVGQVALALVLLAGAGLMLRSFQKLGAVSLGFEPDGITTVAVALPAARYRDHERAASFHEQLASRLTSVPGIERVGFTSHLPLTGKWGCTGVITDRPSATGRKETCVSNLATSPGYFATMGMQLRGRAPDWNETRQRAGGAVVTRALAQVLWPGEDAIGRGIRCCQPGRRWYTVVGVADDVHDEGLDAPPLQAVYFPLIPMDSAQIEDFPSATYLHLAVRAPSMNVATVTGIVERAVAELDPEVPLANPRSMETIIARSMAKRTFTLMLLAVAASMALLLSAVGLYGVVSYVVSQRRGEIGIRIALGAHASQVARMVMSQSLGLVSLGVVIGLAGAVAGTRLLRSLLYEVSPTDPVVLTVVSLLLLALAAVASFAPARRAARVDPAEVMRAE